MEHSTDSEPVIRENLNHKNAAQLLGIPVDELPPAVLEDINLMQKMYNRLHGGVPDVSSLLAVLWPHCKNPQTATEELELEKGVRVKALYKGEAQEGEFVGNGPGGTIHVKFDNDNANFRRIALDDLVRS